MDLTKALINHQEEQNAREGSSNIDEWVYLGHHHIELTGTDKEEAVLLKEIEAFQKSGTSLYCLSNLPVFYQEELNETLKKDGTRDGVFKWN